MHQINKHPCACVVRNWSIVRRSSKQGLLRQNQLPYRLFSYYEDTRFTDRMESLRLEQMNIQKMITSEQLLGLRTTDVDVYHNNNNRHQQPLQYTMKDLRTAYYQAAKQCHPDSQSSSYSKTTEKNDDNDTVEHRFITVTNAYDYLQEQLKLSFVGRRTKERKSPNDATTNDDNVVDDDDEDEEEEDFEFDGIDDIEKEEERYRHACLRILGQPAEIVEESKRCPMFRQWLFGRTDAAYYWQSFFMMHGGLAPQLRKRTITALLSSTNTDTTNGDPSSIPPRAPRRRRKFT